MTYNFLYIVKYKKPIDANYIHNFISILYSQYILQSKNDTDFFYFYFDISNVFLYFYKLDTNIMSLGFEVHTIDSKVQKYNGYDENNRWFLKYEGEKETEDISPQVLIFKGS